MVRAAPVQVRRAAAHVAARRGAVRTGWLLVRPRGHTAVQRAIGCVGRRTTCNGACWYTKSSCCSLPSRPSTRGDQFFSSCRTLQLASTYRVGSRGRVEFDGGTSSVDSLRSRSVTITRALFLHFLLRSSHSTPMVSRLRPSHSNGLGLFTGPTTRQLEADLAGASSTGLTGPWWLNTLPACAKSGHVGDCAWTAERALVVAPKGSPPGSSLEPIQAALSERAGFWSGEWSRCRVQARALWPRCRTAGLTEVNGGTEQGRRHKISPSIILTSGDHEDNSAAPWNQSGLGREARWRVISFIDATTRVTLPVQTNSLCGGVSTDA